MIIRYQNRFLNLSNYNEFKVAIARPNQDVFQVIISGSKLLLEMEKFLDKEEAEEYANVISDCINKGLKEKLTILTIF